MLKEQAESAVKELIDKSGIKAGEILVVGCSSSEIMGDTIGTNSDVNAAQEVFEAIYNVLKEKNIYLAAQCCEHLNRAIVIEKDACDKFGFDEVNVIPQPKAGGSFGTAAYKHFKEPVVVEKITAMAGMDIGDTLIGMHIKPVVVPVRLKNNKIGAANVVCARSRLKYIGGIRAIYKEN